MHAIKDGIRDQAQGPQAQLTIAPFARGQSDSRAGNRERPAHERRSAARPSRIPARRCSRPKHTAEVATSTPDQSSESNTGSPRKHGNSAPLSSNTPRRPCVQSPFVGQQRKAQHDQRERDGHQNDIRHERLRQSGHEPHRQRRPPVEHAAGRITPRGQAPSQPRRNSPGRHGCAGPRRRTRSRSPGPRFAASAKPRASGDNVTATKKPQRRAETVPAYSRECARTEGRFGGETNRGSRGSHGGCCNGISCGKPALNPSTLPRAVSAAKSPSRQAAPFRRFNRYNRARRQAVLSSSTRSKNVAANSTITTAAAAAGTSQNCCQSTLPSTVK